MSRRSRKGLRVERGERYALLPREVAESEPYNAIPDWARSVLFALLSQYHGQNNGSLALPFSQAKLLGVSHQWKLYAGLRTLCDANLLICTRRGLLAAGTKLSSMYGLTWKGIDEPKAPVTYDAGISVCPIPFHAWAKWQKPTNWAKDVKAIEHVARGRQKKIPHTPRGVMAAPHVGSDSAISRSSRGVMETPFLAPHVVVSSKILAGGAAANGYEHTLDSETLLLAGSLRVRS